MLDLSDDVKSPRREVLAHLQNMRSPRLLSERSQGFTVAYCVSTSKSWITVKGLQIGRGHSWHT